MSRCYEVLIRQSDQSYPRSKANICQDGMSNYPRVLYASDPQDPPPYLYHIQIKSVLQDLIPREEIGRDAEETVQG